MFNLCSKLMNSRLVYQSLVFLPCSCIMRLVTCTAVYEETEEDLNTLLNIYEHICNAFFMLQEKIVLHHPF